MSKSQKQEQVDDFTKTIIFNKYRPIKLISEGKCSKIYSVENLINPQILAMKIVNK